MDNNFVSNLKSKLADLIAHGSVDVDVQRNAIKEELQYYVLDFIYHHPLYSVWTMYGGSALRICHGLNRMSVDLDFEIIEPVTEEFLNTLEKNARQYFTDSHSIGNDLLQVKITSGRGLTLKFLIGGELGLDHFSKQVHVKVDLHNFVTSRSVIETIPISHGQLAFVLHTYNMSTLMASKIAAIFLRGQRGVNDAIYQEKGRDIYDLLWYMEKKITPNLDYLRAKVSDIKTIRGLFDRLTIKMNDVSDVNLKQDLTPLFSNRNEVDMWLANWRNEYLRLLVSYQIQTVQKLEEVNIGQDFDTRNYYIWLIYGTDIGKYFRVCWVLNDYWIVFSDGDLQINLDSELEKITIVRDDIKKIDKLKQYATLFFQITERYLAANGRVVVGDIIKTKVIRMTADNFNQKEEIMMDRSALLSCGLEDVLK